MVKVTGLLILIDPSIHNSVREAEPQMLGDADTSPAIRVRLISINAAIAIASETSAPFIADGNIGRIVFVPSRINRAASQIRNHRLHAMAEWKAVSGQIA
jgi:hypothetical protein